MNRRGLHPALATAMVAGLLGVVVVGTHGRSWADASSRSRNLSHAYWDYVFSGAIVIWLVLGAYAAHRMIIASRSADIAERRQRRIIAFVLFVVFLLLISLFGPRIRDRFGNQQPRLHAATAPVSTTITKALPEKPPPVHGQFRWQSAVLTGAVLVAVGGGILIARRLRRRDALSRREAAQALVRLLDDTLDDLRSEPDPRKAVIAAYARMERTLAAYGLPRAPSEAPEEYLRRVLAELDVTGPAAQRLTELFEHAKFSPHEVDGGMKEQAIGALVDLRDELRPEPAV